MSRSSFPKFIKVDEFKNYGRSKVVVLKYGKCDNSIQPCKTVEDKLFTNFQKIIPFSGEETEAIVETITIKQYKKGTVLFRERHISTAAYFVLEGYVRQYYLVDG
jgi:hypothetical protein